MTGFGYFSHNIIGTHSRPNLTGIANVVGGLLLSVSSNTDRSGLLGNNRGATTGDKDGARIG